MSPFFDIILKLPFSIFPVDAIFFKGKSLPVSVADPDPDLPDPHVFGPPGSGSTSPRYGSGSGSFDHHAKIVRKAMIPST